jgi:hypothetical protein
VTTAYRIHPDEVTASGSGSSVGVSGGNAEFPQSVQHGGRVDFQVFAALVWAVVVIVSGELVEYCDGVAFAVVW